MNYIYDIYLNFNETLYDIFEWDKKDNIIHIKKIPLIKVNQKILFDVIHNKVKFKNELLNKIYKKTETFDKNTINYCFIITDSEDIIAIYINNNKIKYSRLLIDEEIDSLEYSKELKETNIEYDIIKKNKYDIYKTKNEIKIKKYIYSKINSLIKENNYDKLEYLYLDIFNKKSNKKIKKELLNELNKKWDNVYLRLYDLLKLIETR